MRLESLIKSLIGSCQDGRLFGTLIFRYVHRIQVSRSTYTENTIFVNSSLLVSNQGDEVNCSTWRHRKPTWGGRGWSPFELTEFRRLSNLKNVRALYIRICSYPMTRILYVPCLPKAAALWVYDREKSRSPISKQGEICRWYSVCW